MCPTLESRHFCRALVLLALLAATGCSTTHNLGRIGDPATTAQLNGLVASPGTIAELVPISGACQLLPTYTLRGASPDGLIVSVGDSPPTLVSYPQVASLKKIDRLRGARNGALAAGISALILGFVVGTTLGNIARCSDGCSSPDPSVLGFKVGGLFALVGAATGGAVGALIGYQDRYVIESAETARAR